MQSATRFGHEDKRVSDLSFIFHSRCLRRTETIAPGYVNVVQTTKQFIIKLCTRPNTTPLSILSVATIHFSSSSALSLSLILFVFVTIDEKKWRRRNYFFKKIKSNGLFVNWLLHRISFPANAQHNQSFYSRRSEENKA